MKVIILNSQWIQNSKYQKNIFKKSYLSNIKNDAPTLKKTDVGFAMGTTGFDVAKDTSDIILLDDNFSSFIASMKWGRNIYVWIRKFIQFQLTVNLVVQFMSFLGAVVLRDSPFNTIEMLWVNLIKDTFASLELATEPPNITVLEHQPYNREDRIQSPTMNRIIVGGYIYQFAEFYLLSLNTWTYLCLKN